MSMTDQRSDGKVPPDRILAPQSEEPPSLESAPTERTVRTGATAAVPAIPDHELLRRIGQGSYGEVWLARNVLGDYRAVKVVYRRTFESERPFNREFEGIKRFEPISRSHESQVQILHVGRAADDSSFYYIMELADDAPEEKEKRGKGEQEQIPSAPFPLFSPSEYTPRTLRSEIQRRGRLPFEDCLEIALKLARAVGHLHQHGLVHRDIKPSNIIFVNGIPKLADIGLVAKADATLSFVGTEGFIPPEGPGKPQADVYGLGKVLYEMSTGRDRQDFPELPTNLRAVSERERLVEFNEIILKACEPELARRYQSADEMHADLVLLQAGKSLKRLRVMERRFRELTRIAALLTILGGGVTAGLLYQRRQTTIVSNLAQREAMQRQRAESALTRIEMVSVSEMLERGEANTALMQLARTLRNEPTNRFAAERLMAAINQKNFLLPLVGPLQHEAQINSACFSPDGRWIATASDDQNARLWSATTGQPLGQPLRHEGKVHSIRFSPDSRKVVTAASDGTARVWEVEAEQSAVVALNHDSGVGYAEFSADGSRILTVSGAAVRVWETRTGRMPGGVIMHATKVNAAHFSPDGKRMATGLEDGTARIWDAATGEPLTTPMRHNSRGVSSPAVNSVQFSPDGLRIVTASQDRTARIWDVLTGEPLAEPLQHNYPVPFARFSPDGRRILTGSNDRTARVWDAFTGQPLTDSLIHTEGLAHGEFSPNGRCLITGETTSSGRVAPMVRVWDAHTGEAVAEPREVGRVNQIAVSPDGRRVLTVSEKSIWIWDALPGETRVSTLGHSGWVGFARFSPDGSLIVTAEESDVSTPAWWSRDFARTEPARAAWIWNAHTGQRIAGPLQHDGGIISAQFSPNGKRIITASRDQTARAWDVATGRPLTDPLAHPQIVRFARFTPDGQRVITASWLDRAWLWDAITGKMLLEFHDTGPGGRSSISMPVRSEDVSADGRWLVTCSRDGARVWNVSNGKFFKGPFAPGENIRAARFSPEGKRIVTASFANTACIWNVETGERMASPLRHDSIVIFAQFSPDGRKVVTCSLDRTTQIWDAETGQPLTKPLKHQGEVLYAEFSPDSRRVVTASWWDRAALLWDAETGLPLSKPLQHDDWVNYATFSPDGRWVVTASNDRKAKLWEIPLAPLPIPAWLPELTEALVGKRLNAQGAPEPVPIEELLALKQQFNSSTATDDYTRWAKWLFADRSRRTISAFSAITIPEYVEELLEENTLRSLAEAVRLSPTNGLAYARLARRIADQTATENPRRVTEADFYRLCRQTFTGTFRGAANPV